MMEWNHNEMEWTKEWNDQGDGMCDYIPLSCLVGLKEWNESFKHVVCYVQLKNLTEINW